MIEVKNLSVQTSKGVVLLDRVEFTLTPGVCTGLTGASGSPFLLPGGLGLPGRPPDSRSRTVAPHHPPPASALRSGGGPGRRYSSG